MQDRLLVFEKPGFIMPDELLKSILLKYKTGFGVACMEPNEPGVFNTKDPKPFSFDEMKALQDQLKDTTAIYYFSNFDKDVGLDNLSPFSVLTNKVGKEDITTMVAFIEGDCKQFWTEGQPDGRLNEFLGVNSYLIPKLQEMFKDAGYDADKLWLKLNMPHVGVELTSTLFDTEGSLVLLGINGKPLKYTKNKTDEIKADWGWASDNLGMEIKAAPPDTGHVETAKEKVARLRAERATKEGKAPVTPPAEKTTPEKVSNLVDIKAVGDAEAAKEEKVLYQIPRYLHKNLKKDLFLMLVGTIPSGVKGITQYHALPSRIEKVKAWLTKIGKDPETGQNATTKYEQFAKQGDTSSVAINAATKDTTNKHISVIVPQSTLKQAVELLTNKDPAKVGKVQQDELDIFEVTGLTMEQTFTVSRERLKALGQVPDGGLDLLVNLCDQYRQEYMSLLNADGAEDKKLKTM